jgi:hypothetical protein
LWTLLILKRMAFVLSFWLLLTLVFIPPPSEFEGD